MRAGVTVAQASSIAARWDAFVVLAAASLAGGLVVQNRIATCAVAVAVLLLTFKRLGRWLCAVALVAFTLGGLRAEARIEAYQHHWQSVRHALGAPKRCVVRGVIDQSPTWRGDSLSFVATLSSAECEGKLLPVSLRARLYGGQRDLARGDRFEGITQLGIVRLFRNLELPDPRQYAARRFIVLSGSVLALDIVERGTTWASRVDTVRAHVRDRIERTFAGPAIGMAKALVLGENDLTEEEDDAFRQSGLAHLLAVSGTHLVFAVVSLVSALRFVLVRVPSLAERTHVERWACLCGALLALFYADFAGGSGSAWRAAWMLTAAFIMRSLDRRPHVARAIAASIFIGVVLDPLAVFDVSFMLSLAATIGLLTLGRKWAPIAARLRHRPARVFTQGVIATLSSMLPCSIFLAMLSPLVSLPGIVMNVLAAPFGEIVALPLCLAHTLLAPLPGLEQGVATVASGALLVVKQAAFISTQSVVRLPVLGLPLPMPNGGHASVLVFTVVLGWFVGKPRNRAASDGPRRRSWRPWLYGLTLLALISVEVATLRAGRPKGILRVSALDVGQGDATLVDFPDGKLMLIDAGGFMGSPVDPGERVVLPLLRARRRSRVDVIVLSHPHPDHFGGLMSVVQNVEVGEFWDTGQGLAEGAGPAYEALMNELTRRHIPIRGPDELCGTSTFGGALLDIVGPCPVVPRRNANDNSWVFRIRHGQRAVLFTGDAEAEEEHEILARAPEALRADLLKIGHHGSRTSTTPAFLAAVQPQLATVSCGVRNRYGHPHQVTLDTLKQQHVTALRLDNLGGVSWQTDGHIIEVASFHPWPTAPTLLDQN